MTATVARLPERAGVDPDNIRIGKDVIELLTSGMYVSPVTVYREYIQNATDAIDAARAKRLIGGNEYGRVAIDFDHSGRSVVIRDNGIGILPDKAADILLAIGGSQKRGTDARGFRGVGRLSGLAYCRELEFRTKVAGSNSVVSLTWDCRGLRERLSSASFEGDLRQTITDVVSLSHDKTGDRADHFFEVHLKEIARLRNDILLNEQIVTHYLAQVAPLPFASDFSPATEIEERLAKYRTQVPIALTVAGQEVHRPFHDELAIHGTSQKLRLDELEFFELTDVDGKPGAIGWLAHHEYVRSLPTALGIRGLRARFGDLQVGESDLFADCFKEPRFNGWCVGEMHVLDRRIVPNARRDNFEVNHHFYNLLVQIGPLTTKIANRCRTASVSRNAAQIVQNVIDEIEGRLAQKRAFDRVELSRLKSGAIRAHATAKRIEDPKRAKRLSDKLGRLRKQLAKRTPKKGASVVALDQATLLVTKLVTNREQARKLLDELRKLCE